MQQTFYVCTPRDHEPEISCSIGKHFRVIQIDESSVKWVCPVAQLAAVELVVSDDPTIAH